MSDNIESIDGFAFYENKKLSKVTLPDKIKTINKGAFANCASLKSIEIPASLEKTAFDYGYDGPFANSGVENVTFEAGTTRIAQRLFRGDAALQKIVIPEGVTSIDLAAFEDCTGLKEVTFPETLTTISESAFNGCTSLGNVDLPDNVTEIGAWAFNKTALTNVKLPEKLETLYRGAFANNPSLTDVTIPKSLETASPDYGYDGPFANSGVENVTFEAGTTRIAQRLFKNCDKLQTIDLPSGLTSIGIGAFADDTALKSIDIPSTVTSIGDRAFQGCTALTDITLPNGLTSRGSNIFKGDTALHAYANYQTNNTIYLIDSNVTFAPSGEKFVGTEDNVVDHAASTFVADTNGMTASGNVPMVVNFSAQARWKNNITDQTIVTYIPEFTTLSETSVRLDGQKVTDYKYDDNTRRLTVSVGEDAGKLTYELKLVSREKIISYAYFQGRKNTRNNRDYFAENIGTVNEEFNGISITGPDTVNSAQVEVSGIAPVDSDVDLYVDGTKQTTVKSSKSGSWKGTVTIPEPKSMYTYSIEARCADPDNRDNTSAYLSASKNVSYDEKTPELKNFKLEYNEHEDKKTLDLMGNSVVKPKVYFTPKVPYTFEARFDNEDQIDKVYVTSTRNNSTRYMEAEYDSATDNYVASGYFDPDNPSYIPGTIGIEYTRKHDKAPVSENFFNSTFDDVKAHFLNDDDVVYHVNETNNIKATVDLSKVFDDKQKALIDASFSYIDDSAGGETFSNIKKAYGLGEKLQTYTQMADDGTTWQFLFNYDPGDKDQRDKVAMIAYDTADAGLTVASKLIEIQLDGAEFGSAEMGALNLASDQLAGISQVIGVAYKTYGIYSDYQDLIDKIDRADDSQIPDKIGAKQKAQELAREQMAFMLATTILKTTAITLGGPEGIVMALMIDMMAAHSKELEDMKVASILGKESNVDWVLDPSGYVYDAETKERISNATVTAYYIPYDAADDKFWENKPADNEYGTKWEASEYEQANPLSTNADGKYAWDVPEGWWRVKCEAGGYKTKWTDWMTVPPIQTEVNIGMESDGSAKDDTDSPTALNIRNKKTYNGSKKITISDADGISTIKIKGKKSKTIRVSGRTKYSLRLSKYAKYLNRKSSWTKLTIENVLKS